MARKPKAKPRSDGRYVSKLRIGRNFDGSPVTKYFYSRVSKADADRQRAAYVLSHPFEDASALRAAYTLRDWCDVWLTSYKNNLAPNTISGYRSACNSLCEYKNLGALDLAQIRPLHITEYVNSLNGTSKSNIRLKKNIVKWVFDAAVENGVISASPASKMPKPNGTYTGHRALSRSEINLITSHYAGHRGGLMMMLMLWAGLRRGEALALCWDDVDLTRKQLTVHRSLDIGHKTIKSTKTEAGIRVIPMFPPLYNALLEAMPVRHAKNALVCTAATGAQYTDTAYERVMDSFRLYLERVLNGVDNPERASGWRRDLAVKKFARENREWQTVEYTAHDLRYTFATLCFDADVDVQTTKVWMGHRDIETTMRIYTKLSTERHQQSTEAMERFAASFLPDDSAESDTPLTPLH